MTPKLTQNLQVIATRFPEVFEELKTQVHSNPDAFTCAQFLESIYGSLGREDLLNRWLKAAPLSKLRVVVTTGFGDGSHIRKLLESIPSSSCVCTIECDPAMLLSVLCETDVSTLLANPRFILLTPFCYREIITRLNLELIGIESASTFLYAPVYNRSPDLYKNVIAIVLRQLTTRWNQIKTDVENAEIVFENSIKNLSEIQFGSEIFSLYKIFENKPLILVGAGPSLDESFEFLKRAQGKAIIAVVNSAYRAVVKHGIKPDITVAVDPKEGTFRGYQGTDTSHPVLICTYLVYPKVPLLFPDRVFPLSSYNFLISLLRRVLKLQEEPGIVGDGTVSSTVVNLAAFFGCNEVYLVGQDMAISRSGRIHTTDSFYTDDGSNQCDLSTCKWIDGNNGEKVPVEAKLYAYLKIFENQVSHNNSIQFYNLAREGSRIHGAPYITFEQANSQLCKLPTVSYHDQLLDKLQSSRFPKNTFLAAMYFFERYLEFLNTTLQPMMSFAVKGEIQIDCQNLQLSDPALQSTPIGQAHQGILKQFTENPLFTSLLVEGRSKREYFDFICAEEEWSLISDLNAPVKQALPQAWALVEGILFQIEIIEDHLIKATND